MRRVGSFLTLTYSPISIHAPVKGATGYGDVDEVLLHEISIHAPVKGATTDPYQNAMVGMDFNPRTREGCDSLQIGSVTICSLINHIAN